MTRLLPALVLLTACGAAPITAPIDASLTGAQATLHYDHSTFASFTANTQIKDTTGFFMAAGAFGQADAKVSVTLPVGQYIRAFRANVYGDTVGGRPRILDLTLYRVGSAICPEAGSDAITGPPILPACAIATVNLYLTQPDGWRDSPGWHVQEMALSHVVEAGFTYQVIATLRGTTITDKALRVESAEIDYAATPSAPAPVSARDRIALARVQRLQ